MRPKTPDRERDNGDHGETLLIHPGGLGDVCLSESTLLSLKKAFGPVEAVGNKRVLDVFGEYFTGVGDLGSRAWMHLFSDSALDLFRGRAAFIGKDRTGAFRERLSRLCEELLFIDMYPDERPAPVEEYQLGQLSRYGIEPVRKEIAAKMGKRVILYPEGSYRKKKWPVDCFLEVYERLGELEVERALLRPPELCLPAAPSHAFDLLADIALFFAGGGLFFSNDSGMAHFAARCGLLPVTLFQETDPLIWRPRGGLVLHCPESPPSIGQAVDAIMQALGRDDKAGASFRAKKKLVFMESEP